MAGVIVVDYGVGNLGSILNMFKKLGVEAESSSDPEKIASSERLLMPGVGAFDTAMHKLHASGLIPVLERKVFQDKVPLLGICLGMQILTEGSEEGTQPGLGWISAKVRRFDLDEKYKVPHMGWNTAVPTGPHKIFDGLDAESRFYFVHSYHAECREELRLCKSHYGYEFTSGLVKDNIMGLQFHPEKSHKFGLQLLKNFAAI